MDLIALIAGYGAWSWIVAGLVLLALELVVPGGVLVWLGAAALVTGGLSMLLPIYWPLQFVLYGVLALLAIWLWLKSRRGETPTDSPYLNNRATRFVGQEAVLSEPIRGGFGRLALDDTTWRVAGPDLEAGQRVRIVKADGPVLTVEAV
jgi:membrane protein implicated in regulation of membrane protease activity